MLLSRSGFHSLHHRTLIVQQTRKRSLAQEGQRRLSTGFFATATRARFEFTFDSPQAAFCNSTVVKFCTMSAVINMPCRQISTSTDYGSNSRQYGVPVLPRHHVWILELEHTCERFVDA